MSLLLGMTALGVVPAAEGAVPLTGRDAAASPPPARSSASVPVQPQAKKPKASLRTSATKAAAGAAIKLTGTVRGAKAKQKVTLQVKRAGAAWTTASTARLAKSGKVSFTVRPTLGANQYRITTTVKKKTVRSKAVKVTVAPAVAPASRVVAGQQVTVTGTLPTRGKRPIVLQGRSGGTWRVLATGKTKAKGSFTLRFRASRAMALRVRAAATTVKKQRLKAFTSPQVAVKVQAQQATVRVEPQLCTAQQTSVTVAATAIGSRRPVTLQLSRAGGAWQTWAQGRTSSSGTATITVAAPDEADSYRVRAVVAGAGKIAGVTSSSSDLEVAPCGSEPGPQPPVVESGGYHTCLLDEGGDIWCWGGNKEKQRGTPGPEKTTTPAKVDAGVKFKDLSLGPTLSCGLEVSGKVYCWGTLTTPSLDPGDDYVLHSPSLVSGQTLRFTSISVGTYHLCGLSSFGQVWCWGLKRTSPASDAGWTLTSAPVLVPGARRYTEIDTDETVTCGLSQAGERWCWGGVGPDDPASNAPGLMPGSQRFVTFSNSCGLDAAGKAYCWGTDFYGLLGDGTGGPATSVEPVPVAAGLTFTAISSTAGIHGTACGITTSGNVYCWGYGAYGQIGDGYSGSRNSPTPLFFSGPTRTFKQISVGKGAQVCAVRDETTGVYCWGWNHFGQLGYGSIGGAALAPQQLSWPA